MILLVSGSLRHGSTNSALLRTAAAIDPDTVLYDGMRDLPHFDPDDDTDPLHPEVVRLRDAIEAADGLVLCAPTYAGALPGSFKNLLDWTVGGMQIQRKPVAIVNVSAVGSDGGTRELRTVLGYVQADVVEAASRHLPIGRDQVGPDGEVTDEAIREQVRALLDTLRAHTTAAQ